MLGEPFVDLNISKDSIDGAVADHAEQVHAVELLVGRGDILQAQHRLGHRDASTILRIYSHAMPLTDSAAAATLDGLFR